jgi:arylsulfatase A-like enzyme
MYKKTRRSVLKSLMALPTLPLLDRLSVFAGTERTASQTQKVPNVLILLFDTLSARHMSLYGYRRKTTPNLDRLAERATVYHAHHVAGPYTIPSTASILTGTYPWSHRALSPTARVANHVRHRNLFRAFAGTNVNRIAYAHNNYAYVFLDQFRQEIDELPAPSAFYLVGSGLLEQVFPRDWAAAYRSDELNSENMLMQLRLELLERVLNRRYASQYPRGIGEQDGGFFVLEHAINGVKEMVCGSRQPFCAYMHLLPPHDPYRARKEFVGLFDDGWVPAAKPLHHFSIGFSDKALNENRSRYDEYIAHVDSEFGRLYHALERAGVLENTYLILISDHGELFERGILGHESPTLYEPLLHTPLVIFKPKQQQREDVHTLTSAVDLLPTLCHLAGIEIPNWCEGDILPTFGGQQPNPERTVYAMDARRTPARAPVTTGTVSLLRHPFKLTHYFGYEGYQDEYELYDLEADPEEINNLYSRDHPVAVELENALATKVQEVNHRML